jgi:hypothetical protein
MRFGEVQKIDRYIQNFAAFFVNMKKKAAQLR